MNETYERTDELHAPNECTKYGAKIKLNNPDYHS